MMEIIPVQLLFCRVLWLREPWLGIKGKILQYNVACEVLGTTEWHNTVEQKQIVYFIYIYIFFLSWSEFSDRILFPQNLFFKNLSCKASSVCLPVLIFVLCKIETLHNFFVCFVFIIKMSHVYFWFIMAMTCSKFTCYPGYLLSTYTQIRFILWASAASSHGGWTNVHSELSSQDLELFKINILMYIFWQSGIFWQTPLFRCFYIVSFNLGLDTQHVKMRSFTSLCYC